MKIEKYSPLMNEVQICQLAADLVWKRFENLSITRNIKTVNSGVADFCFDIEFNTGMTCRIFGLVKNNGEPRIIRNAINTLKDYASDYINMRMYNIFVAPYISSDSVEIFRENKVGYMDFCGNCLLQHDMFYIEVSGNRNKYVEKRDNKNYLARSSVAISSILREMLYQHQKYWQVKELSDITKTSIGMVSNVKTYLLNKEWAITYDGKFRISNVESLMKAWSSDYNKGKDVSYEFYSLDTIPEIEYNLHSLYAKKGIKCTLTSFSAAVRYSPTVRYNKVSVYVEQQDFDEVINELNLKKVDTGGNVTIIIPYNECVLMHAWQTKDAFVVSPVQAVLDLMQNKSRGEEAAQAIIFKEYRDNG